MKTQTPLTHSFMHVFSFVLARAAHLNASDIHFAPRGTGGEVRLRVSGSLLVLQRFDDALQWNDLIKVAKTRAGFSFTTGIAQDSRFSDLVTNCDYRASIVPVQIGDRACEQIVLRALPRNAHFELGKLGLPASAVSALRDALNANSGLIVVTGPTGSGKTVTLMATLLEIALDKYSVLTLEDPVEYALPGITQVQISEKLSFAQGLRAFLRQDPDYILVGETRDSETAKALLQAASTGHVVLTTLHTNSAAEVFTRLSGLGVEEDLVRANASFICAQRLVPKLCPHCSEDALESVELVSRYFAHEISAEKRGELIPKRSFGCTVCNQTGVLGRVLLFEFISKSAEQSSSSHQNKVLVQHSSLKNEAFKSLSKGEINALEATAFC